jgi:hypothetical protein
MTRHTVLAVACVALVALSGATRAQAQAGQQAASAAASASPELVSALSKEMGSTPEQAAGAAGALFGLAKTKLKAEDFSQIAAAVPGMDSLLKAAPAAAPAAGGTGGAGGAGAVGTTGGLGSLDSIASTLGGLPGVAGTFSKLGLSPDMVAKAIPVLTSFVTKSGGANVGNLLAGALK